MCRSVDEILKEREEVDEKIHFLGRTMPVGLIRPDNPEWDTLHVRRSVLNRELYTAQAPERAVLENTRIQLLQEAINADTIRIAGLPIWQRRNKWHIVRDGVKYVLRHPVTLEEVYSGKLKRCREVADESLPEVGAGD